MIYFLCRRYCSGEAWTNRILAYAKGLSELGCKVTLVYCITNLARTPYCIDIPGVSVINLWEKDNTIEKRLRALSYLHNLCRVRKILNVGDKVFVYGAEWNLIKAASKQNVDVYAEVTEHPYKYNLKGKKGEKRIDKHYKKLDSKIKGLCVITKSLYQYFSSIGISEQKLRVSNMFVDSERFIIDKSDSVLPYIAYCGVLTYGKDGVDTLIKSFAVFHQTHQDYQLYLIGRAGSDAEMASLKALSKKEGLDKAVVFTGQIAPSEMPRMLVDAKILALARPNNLQAQNGFPTKLGEYLSTGNPVVVTSVGEIPLFIKDGINGYLANPDDIESFTEKLSWVADNYQKACMVAAEGKKLAENEFSYKTQSKILFDLMNHN